jgi:hypothetical protein
MELVAGQCVIFNVKKYKCDVPVQGEKIYKPKMGFQEMEMRTFRKKDHIRNKRPITERRHTRKRKHIKVRSHIKVRKHITERWDTKEKRDIKGRGCWLS